MGADESIRFDLGMDVKVCQMSKFNQKELDRWFPFGCKCRYRDLDIFGFAATPSCFPFLVDSFEISVVMS